VTRLWAFHRKTGSAAAASATLYYKTMRLMVRLPRGVVRNPDGSITNNLFSMSGNRGPVELDWVTGALYFTEADEGNVITVTTHAYARDPANGSPLFVPQASYRVGWGDEGFAASQPGVQPAAEFIVPTESAVNEGQLAAFKDPFQDKVWLFWSSTRAGTTDLYYMTVRPQIYPQVAGP
jgi:hypothetical protein